MNIFYDYQSIFRQHFGGVTRYHYELYKELSEMQGIQVRCQCYGSPNYYFKDILGYRPIRNYYGMLGFFYHLNRITNSRQIASKKYDVIHPTWYDPYCFYKKKKGQYVITIHDMIHEKFPGFPAWEVEGKKFWIYHADKIIAVSENTKKDILDIYPDIDEDKITVVYHGRNVLPPPKPVYTISDTYLLYVGGRGYAYKNFFIVLKAMKIIIEKYKDLKLICVGGGAFSEREKELIQELNLDGYIHQMQATDEELAYLYSNALCLVYPSYYEGFGFPILEAFSCNCPIVLSNATSLPEIAGNAVLYFEPFDMEEMIEHIFSLLEHPSKREDLIEKGKARLELFSWNKTAMETLDVYNSLY